MTDIFLVVVGLVLGGIIAWTWASSQARSSSDKEVADVKKRARLAEQLWDGLRQQVQQKEKEILALRSSCEDERRAATEVQTRLLEAHRTAQEEKKTLEEATIRLSDAFQALSSAFLETNNQSFLELAHYQDIGKSMNSAISAYHAAVEAMESRILTTARRLKELGASTDQEPPDIASGTQTPQETSLPVPTVVVHEEARTHSPGKGRRDISAG